MKVLGALVKPKGITSHSYKPNLVLKVVFHSSPNFILIWWYPLLKSSFEKIIEPLNSSSMSSNLGIGWWYHIVILLMPLQSTHMRQLPSFFGTKITRIAQGLRFSRHTHGLEVLDLALNLLSLPGVGFVGSSVWQARSRNQVNLVLNPSNGWKSWRYLTRNTSLYSCNVLEISSVENKASLHIKA